MHLVETSLAPINPHIGPLANNGGPTKTIALLSGSPAINAGNSALAEAYGITTDQHGAPRFPPGGDGMVDIGAYEVDTLRAHAKGEHRSTPLTIHADRSLTENFHYPPVLQSAKVIRIAILRSCGLRRPDRSASKFQTD